MATGQTSLAELQRRQALLQALMQKPQERRSPVGAGLEGLAQIIAARGSKKLGDEAASFEQEQRGKDMSALAQIFQGQSADPSQLGLISDPRIQELAASFIAQQNKPVRPVSVPAGGTLVNPQTGETIAQGAPKPRRLMQTDVPGLLFDPDTGEQVDLLNQGQGGSLSEFRETPQQKRERETQEALRRKEEEAEIKATKEKEKNFPRVQRLLQQTEQQTNVVLQNIDRALELADKAAGAGVLLAGLPASDFRELDQRLKTIKANVGFAKLQDMRQSSPTGGALGNVSDRENENLQAVAGSLDQGQRAEVLKENLRTIRNLQTGGLDLLRDSFQQDFADLIEPQGQGGSVVDELPDPASLAEGTRAVDDETGEVFVIQNGKWTRAVQN